MITALILVLAGLLLFKLAGFLGVVFAIVLKVIGGMMILSSIGVFICALIALV